MMIRRTIAVIAGFVLSVGMLSACTSTVPAQETGSVTKEVPTQVPLGVPQDKPPVVENSLVVVSDLDVDTSKFTSPVTIAGWRVMNAGLDAVGTPYAVIGLVLSNQDWNEFAFQAGFDSSVTFDQAQLDYSTASSLYDTNQLAGEILETLERRSLSPIDIREVETYWSIVVL